MTITTEQDIDRLCEEFKRLKKEIDWLMDENIAAQEMMKIMTPWLSYVRRNLSDTELIAFDSDMRDIMQISQLRLKACRDSQ